MANRAVTLMWYCRTEKGWRRFPALLSNNGKVRTGVVLVDGKERDYPDGRFQLRTFNGTSKVYQNVESTSPSDALAERKRLELRLAARHSATEAGTKIVEQSGRVALRTAAAKYVQTTRDAGAAEAAIVYAKALEHFIEAMDGIGVRYVDEVNEAAMLRFHGHLRHKGNGPRTIANKHAAVKGFLLSVGVDKKTLGKRKPQYVKMTPVAYDRDELSTLLASNRDPYFAVVLDVLRMAGLREQEAVYLQWADIDLKAKVLTVTEKPDEGFRTKDKEERPVPMPDELVMVLRQWKKEHPDAKWVLGTAGDKPNRKWLRTLKRLAKRAGLNCNACAGCKKHGECRHWTLHAFRRSYATSLARAGVDVHAIRDLLGHSDLQTTLRYLASMKTEAKRVAVNAVSW